MKVYEKPNDAWIMHREDIETIKEGSCNVYFLLDAVSGFCFTQKAVVDLLSSSEILEFLNIAYKRVNGWPKEILISKKDPLLETLEVICKDKKLNFKSIPPKDLAPFVKPLKDSLKNFKMGNPSQQNGYSTVELSEEEAHELETFVPDTYDPCPCASGKKFKFCCKPIFKNITFAMCAAQDGQLEEALKYMDDAKLKVGETSEVLCRYGICWSFFDMNKADEYLLKAYGLNPKHPRTNYILGINSMERGDFKAAIKYYLEAANNYPVEDKFHLNEAYNNLGSVYYDCGDYKAAKDAWEKALVFFPLDRITKNNLFEFIYNNKIVPKDIREISPFIKKYLKLD
jgi:tetratricopeptide (TPR) repeat protein